MDRVATGAEGAFDGVVVGVNAFGVPHSQHTRTQRFHHGEPVKSTKITHQPRQVGNQSEGAKYSSPRQTSGQRCARRKR